MYVHWKGIDTDNCRLRSVWVTLKVEQMAWSQVKQMFEALNKVHRFLMLVRTTQYILI